MRTGRLSARSPGSIGPRVPPRSTWSDGCCRGDGPRSADHGRGDAAIPWFQLPRFPVCWAVGGDCRPFRNRSVQGEGHWREAALKSVDVRRDLVEALRLDLVGPNNDDAFARELLPEPPTRWYLTGVLSPAGAQIDDADDSDEQLELGGDLPGATDDASTPDKGAAKKSIMPSSIGVSV